MSREAQIGVVAGGSDPLPDPPPGLVRLRAVDTPTLGLIAELDGHVEASGYGTWTSIERPGKLPITDYDGLSPLTLKLGLLLDRWGSQGSIEPEIKVLETMLGRHGIDRAPVLIIEGPGIPFSYSRDASLRFVLGGDPDWGDDIRTRGTSGERCFARVSVTALQYTAPQRKSTLDAKTRRYYTVSRQKGSPNTLKKIAKRKKTSAHLLLQLNAGNKKVPRDPAKKIKAGTKVRIA